jgi:hypothetical protein
MAAIAAESVARIKAFLLGPEYITITGTQGEQPRKQVLGQVPRQDIHRISVTVWVDKYVQTHQVEHWAWATAQSGAEH